VRRRRRPRLLRRRRQRQRAAILLLASAHRHGRKTRDGHDGSGPLLPQHGRPLGWQPLRRAASALAIAAPRPPRACHLTRLTDGGMACPTRCGWVGGRARGGTGVTLGAWGAARSPHPRRVAARLAAVRDSGEGRCEERCFGALDEVQFS